MRAKDATRLLAIDVGTTGVRAALYDGGGTRLAEASEPCPHRAPAPGHAEADAETWWSAVAATCRAVAKSAPLDHVDAVGVTGQAPTAVLVDASFRPLRPAILWLDVRAGEAARALERALGASRAEAIGGNRVHPYFLGPKLAWLRAHDAAALEGAAFVLQSHAFVAARLTGVAACDPSTAMLCAPLYDARAGTWSGEAADATGVPLRVLPPLMRAQDVLGAVTAAAAAATGLPEGAPVVAGGGDFAASALGAGVVDEGEACAMLGTAGNLLLPMREPRFDPRLLQSHHVGCDRWLALGGTLCGAAIAWFCRTCAVGATLDELEAEAAAVAVGAEGVVFLPYLQGERTPVWDETARGAFAGLDLTHGRGHLYRAVLEGIALGFRHCLEVAEAGGTTLTSLVATNGAGKSAVLRQSLADAMGVPVTWSPDAGGTLAGAAILAGIGVGAIDRIDMGRAWRSPEVRRVTHAPDPRAHESLGRVLASRKALHAAVPRA